MPSCRSPSAGRSRSCPAVPSCAAWAAGHRAARHARHAADLRRHRRGPVPGAGLRARAGPVLGDGLPAARDGRAAVRAVRRPTRWTPTSSCARWAGAASPSRSCALLDPQTAALAAGVRRRGQRLPRRDGPGAELQRSSTAILALTNRPLPRRARGRRSTRWRGSRRWPGTCAATCDDEIEPRPARRDAAARQVEELYPAYPYDRHPPIVDARRDRATPANRDRRDRRHATRRGRAPCPARLVGRAAARSRAALDALPTLLGPRGTASARTRGWSPATTPRPASRCSPTTRTSGRRCRRSGTRWACTAARSARRARSTSPASPSPGVPGVVIGHNADDRLGLHQPRRPTSPTSYLEKVDGDTLPVRGQAGRPRRPDGDHRGARGRTAAADASARPRHGPLMSDVEQGRTGAPVTPEATAAVRGRPAVDRAGPRPDRWTPCSRINRAAGLGRTSARGGQPVRGAGAEHRVRRHRRPHRLPGARADPGPRQGLDGQLAGAGLDRRVRVDRRSSRSTSCRGCSTPPRATSSPPTRPSCRPDYPDFLTDDWDYGYRAAADPRPARGAGRARRRHARGPDGGSSATPATTWRRRCCRPCCAIDVPRPSGRRARTCCATGTTRRAPTRQPRRTSTRSGGNLLGADVRRRAARGRRGPTAATAGSRSSRAADEPGQPVVGRHRHAPAARPATTSCPRRCRTPATSSTDRLGNDPDGWRWGELHALHAEHQTFGTVRASRRSSGCSTAAPSMSAAATRRVDATGWYADEGYEVDWVPSMRMVSTWRTWTTPAGST